MRGCRMLLLFLARIFSRACSRHWKNLRAGGPGVPAGDEFLQIRGAFGGEVVEFGAVVGEVVEFPFSAAIGFAGRGEDGFQVAVADGFVAVLLPAEFARRGGRVRGVEQGDEAAPSRGERAVPWRSLG